MAAADTSSLLAQIATQQFGDIIAAIEVVSWSQQHVRVMRLRFVDQSFLDIRLTARGDYSYHWEHRMVDGGIHRWDNAPHHQHIVTYPHHLHDGEETNVVASSLPLASADEALKYVLTVIAARLRPNAHHV